MNTPQKATKRGWTLDMLMVLGTLLYYFLDKIVNEVISTDYRRTLGDQAYGGQFFELEANLYFSIGRL